MIFALMLTCGWRKSRLRVYSSSSGSALGMSVIVTLLVIVSPVTVPRTGHAKLWTTLTCGSTGAGGGATPGAPAGAVGAWPAVAVRTIGQVRVRRSATIGATALARA